MDVSVLTRKLTSLVATDAFNYWEVEEFAEQLASFPEEAQQEVLKQVAVIWPVSHALCFAFLEQLPQGLSCLHPSQLSEWVNAVLDAYEKEGLHQARAFMADVERNFLCRLRGETGLTLEEAKGRLLPYLRGLAGRELDLAPGSEIYTDTCTIYLFPEISLFRDAAGNFLAYKLAASFQWALLSCGTFDFLPGPDHPLSRTLLNRYGRPWLEGEPPPAGFFGLFPRPPLASEIYLLLETFRAAALLQSELPGLMRDGARVLDRLHWQRPPLTGFAGRGLLVEALRQWVLTRKVKGVLPSPERRIFHLAREMIEPLGEPGASAEGSAAAAVSIYRLLEPLPDSEAAEPLAISGRLKPAAIQAARQQWREAARQQFIEALAAILLPAAADPSLLSAEAPGEPGRLPQEEGIAIVPPDAAGSIDQTAEPEQVPDYLVIGGREVEIPESLRPLASEIRKDLGRIPRQYVAAALQRAGRAPSGGPGPLPAEGQKAQGRLIYDEWDYRRSGFRKDWCLLQQKEVQPVGGNFVESTLRRYRGPLRQLKRQFEMMRLQQRFLRRQQDGDDIDLDAVIESLADLRAGRSPSENLFIRLSRDERNIAAVFLVDMSSSTEGWVNTAIKESLVLMCEALEVLGDPYAIYGFSGMRRLRSELYHVKHLDEPYDQETKGRIAAITPREYTRMGPPIRHVAELLKATDARVRLLITLSDGKPEDYDDYKGDYAIEDTRHALIEAKAAGIHPFCITIDQEAHDYIPHMYGEVNYIFIDEVRKLPLRMPEIYRRLTT